MLLADLVVVVPGMTAVTDASPHVFWVGRLFGTHTAPRALRGCLVVDPRAVVWAHLHDLTVRAPSDTTHRFSVAVGAERRRASIPVPSSTRRPPRRSSGAVDADSL